MDNHPNNEILIYQADDHGQFILICNSLLSNEKISMSGQERHLAVSFGDAIQAHYKSNRSSIRNTNMGEPN